VSLLAAIGKTAGALVQFFDELGQVWFLGKCVDGGHANNLPTKKPIPIMANEYSNTVTISIVLSAIGSASGSAY
jgi:hypothetical protein